MRRLIVLVIGVSVASLAVAQPVPTCRTTTTVECTGSAAPLAVPYESGGQAVAPPAPVYPPSPAYAPPPGYPSNAPPPGMPVPGTPYAPVNPQHPWVVVPPVLGNGWRLVTAPDGQLLRERRTHSMSPALFGTGLATLLVSYLGSGFGTLATHHAGRGVGFVPVFGAFAETAFSLDNGSRGAAAAWAVAGVLQIGGIVMTAVGGVAREKVERIPFRIGFGATSDAATVTLGGRF